ncbi:hypothetical protein [Streptomyces sp. CNS654]|uniref:hypothetical protein n=1 Tax=Streptomyces sp. CNS654 TaxID=1506995 RepID=UPI001F244C1D|nr:hypothetical protein [Streptomyces sp. CNS654]
MKIRMLVPAFALSMLVGCSFPSFNSPKGEESSRMNMEEAANRAEEILDGTMGAIEPPVTWGRGPSSEPICTDFKNDATGGGEVTRRRLALTIISAERRGSFLGVVERYWKKSGYTIKSVRNHPENPAIFASTSDGFGLSLEVGYKGQVFLDVGSPCVTKSEVSDPPADPHSSELPPNPNDPKDPMADGPWGLPYLTSDFWSAKPAPEPSGNSLPSTSSQ